MTGLERRLIALEAAPALARTVYRAFGTDTEAEADREPAPGVTVVRIITGVCRTTGPDPNR